ncbi:MAG: metallophosphoesterase family protein [Thermoleophilia bacterium]|nr:metallophosphoesterase family protein [Thermoleophilia bacterium]
MRVGVISDTHMPVRARALPAACRDVLAGCDLILHAGDHADGASLAALRAIGPPVVAVHGNADGEDLRRALPASAEVDAGGVRIAVVHDAGPREGRIGRLRRRFPGADVVVFGHSHVPLVERDAGGFAIVNPGSPTDKRTQPHHTMALVRVDGGRAEAEIVILERDDPA